MRRYKYIVGDVIQFRKHGFEWAGTIVHRTFSKIFVELLDDVSINAWKEITNEDPHYIQVGLLTEEQPFFRAKV